MSTYFENKLTYNGISFLLSDHPSVDEREIHAYHEILFCMDADTMFFTEKQQKKIRGDVLFLIPKANYHFFSIQDCEKFSRLKISFPADVLDCTPCRRIMSDICIIEKIDKNVYSVLKRLCYILEGCSSEKQGFYAYSAFLMLLTELDCCEFANGPVQETEATGEMSPIIRYISENLSKDLSIEMISQRMNVSASAITHSFKKEFGVSVHQYILQKRLIYAQSLILAGNKPSKIFCDVGYRDYSSFYKAYINFFGYPPSKELLESCEKAGELFGQKK